MSRDLSLEKDKVAIAQRELEKSHRLQQLGQLAAGVAHEIRNPMVALSSQAELLPWRNNDFFLIYEYNKNNHGSRNYNPCGYF